MLSLWTFPAAERMLQSQGGLETLLQDVFADAASFGRSDNRQLMGKVIEEYLKENIGKIGAGGNVREVGVGEVVFDLKGVDLYEGKIGRTKRGGKKSDGRKRYLRASRRAQEASSSVEEEVIEVTYSFTARGSYNVSLNATNILSSTLFISHL
jgi:hypothetical protein